MVASFKANNINEEDIAKSDGDEYDTDSVSLEESEELFPDKDQLDKKEEGASSEVDNFDICDKEQQEAFVGWKSSGCFVHMLQLVVKVIETATAYSRRVNSELAIVKEVNKSCTATEYLMQLAKKLLQNCLTRWNSLFLVICQMFK